MNFIVKKIKMSYKIILPFLAASAFAADPGTHRSRLQFQNTRSDSIYVRVMGYCPGSSNPCQSYYVSYAIESQDTFTQIPNNNSIGKTLTIPSHDTGTMYIECGYMNPNGQSNSEFLLQISTDPLFSSNAITARFKGQETDSNDGGVNDQSNWPDGFNGYWELSISPSLSASGVNIAAYNDTSYYDKIPNTEFAVVDHDIKDDAGLNAITIYSTAGTSLPGGFFAR